MPPSYRNTHVPAVAYEHPMQPLQNWTLQWEQRDRSLPPVHQKYQGSLPITFPKERRSWLRLLSPLPKNQEPMLSIWHNTAKSSHLSHFENHPLQTTLNNDEILSLSGNTLTTYHDAKGLSDGDVKASMRIKQFIEQYPQEHARTKSSLVYSASANSTVCQPPKSLPTICGSSKGTVPSWSL